MHIFLPQTTMQSHLSLSIDVFFSQGWKIQSSYSNSIEHLMYALFSSCNQLLLHKGQIIVFYFLIFYFVFIVISQYMFLWHCSISNVLRPELHPLVPIFSVSDHPLPPTAICCRPYAHNYVTSLLAEINSLFKYFPTQLLNNLVKAF